MSTPFVNWIKRDLRHGNTPIVVFCGRPRSGKTATAMRFAWEIRPKTFNYDHVASNIEQFADLFMKFENDIIILDEASDSLYIYDWNSLFQKVFSIINDTQAYKHNVVFIILPMVHKLGKLHRYDVDGIIQTKKLRNYETKKDEVYYRFKIHFKNYDDLLMRPPRTMTILEWCGAVPFPPDHIWIPYITKGQKEFKQGILEKQIKAMFKKAQGSIPQARDNAIDISL